MEQNKRYTHIMHRELNIGTIGSPSKEPIKMRDRLKIQNNIIIGILKCCGSCEEENCYGVEWNPNNDGYNREMTNEENNQQLCFNCIFSVALHFQSQQSWHNKNGDPIINLRRDLQSQIDDLETKIKELHSTVHLPL